jgi:parallel beta-helix repeat protein
MKYQGVIRMKKGAKINGLLTKTSLVLLSLCSTGIVQSADRPPVTYPRATCDDSAIRVNWDERLTITVGQKDADIVGANQKAIQAAVDYVARLGGGTVKILPGIYRLRNAVYLQSNVRLLGSGDTTILIKEPSTLTKLSEDSDWYDQEITLTDANGFEVGDGVWLQAKKEKAPGEVVVRRTLVARSGNRFMLDKGIRENLWQRNDATVSTLFALISGEFVNDAVIENLVLDGNRMQNAKMNGNYAGCIFLQDCNRVTIRGVTARNNNGDGMSWQICHDVLVENCTSENNAAFGLHPGSGSQRPVIRGNKLKGNDIGIFFCWGVKYAMAEENLLEGNRLGISIGHRDTDNLIAGNKIIDSKANGILFRPECELRRSGHRSRIENNQLINNGEVIAIDIQGGPESLKLVGNEITDTRGKSKLIAVRIGPDVKNIEIKNNRISGFTTDVDYK